jgi:hypothetical protein
MVADLGEGTEAGPRDWNFCKSGLRVAEGGGSFCHLRPPLMQLMLLPLNTAIARLLGKKEKESGRRRRILHANLAQRKGKCVCVYVCVSGGESRSPPFLLNLFLLK